MNVHEEFDYWKNDINYTADKLEALYNIMETRDLTKSEMNELKQTIKQCFKETRRMTAGFENDKKRRQEQTK